MDLIRKISIALFSITISFNYSLAQKKIVDHNAYNSWKRLSGNSISNDGLWIGYEKNPYKGDGEACWFNTQTKKQDSLARATKLQFSFDNSFLITKIQAPFDSIHKLQLDGVKKDKLPKDTLAIVKLKDGSIQKISDLLDVKLASKSGWVAYRTNTNELKTDSKKKKKKEKEMHESDGKLLFVVSPSTDKKLQWQDVTSYKLSKKGNWIAIVTQEKKDKKEVTHLIINSLTEDKKINVEKFTDVGKITWSEDEKLIAFLASKDTVKKDKIFNLYIIDLNDSIQQDGNFMTVVDTNFTGITQENTVSENGQIWFSKNGKRLYLGTANRPIIEPKDTLLEKEKAVVDIWNWQDHQLQPRQLVNLNSQRKRTNLSVFNIEDKTFITLESDTLDISLGITGDENTLLAYSKESYEKSYDYAYPWKSDVYTVNVENGDTKLLFQGMENQVSISPNGSGVAYFNSEKKNYYYKNLTSNNEVCLTCGLDYNWFDDKNGSPHQDEPLSIVGWSKNRNALIVQSEFDLFQLDLDGSSKECLTIGLGKEQKQIMRFVNWDKDSAYIDLNRTWIQGFNQETKMTSLYNVTFQENQPIKLTQNYTIYASVIDIEKATDADMVTFRQSTIQAYPELWLSNAHFENPLKISITNPQQNEYNWSNVQLVKWKTPKGIDLQGLLYTPEDLDTTKSYPMLVYFYELNSDNIHRYYAPKPTASIIYPTEYASSGYVVFIPDVRYEPGHPAEYAYDCIVSGTDYITRNFSFVDSNRVGIQGQSWGGYQVAQLITMTTKYKAAMAGAPVSNMFSAYGGIRWGSGLSRMFQYEHTQSRIGATIWEKPELYIENSPIFGLPKVETPLLIMHNDGDGSVPWYQGIEMFMGLRRLHKPVWLLNYNGDDHNLMKEPNRIDLSIRMHQFFDHFLKGAPAPKWLSEGIRATEKGKITGY